MDAGSPGAIAIANYDFRASGTVAKSIQIASAAHAAGLPVELWAVRARGPLLARVPAGLPVIEAGSRYIASGARAADLCGSIGAFAHTLRQRRPAVLLSAGNHLHLAARLALGLSGMRGQVRLGLRVSNSSRHRSGARIPGTAGPLARIKFAGADFVAAVSSELAREVRALVPGLDVECIPNGCDLASVRRLMREEFRHPFLDGGTPVITAMGRLAHQKGFDNLIRALALLRRDVDARLLVIGDGGSGQRTALQRLAAREGVTAQVQLLGYLPNPFALIARSQLFVCASRWEGSCNALLEALACEVPVVATDCPTGNAELLLGGRLGELAPPGSATGLAAAMRRELATHRMAAERWQHLERLDLARCMDRWTGLLARELRGAGRSAVFDVEPQRVRS